MKFINSPELKSMFKKYEKPMKALFNHYTLENGGDTTDTVIKANGWKKLGL